METVEVINRKESSYLEKPNSSDTISRHAAIGAICTEGTRLERNGTVAMAEIKQWCVDILEALPSAQPERKTGEWILSDVQNPEDVRNGNYTYTCSNCLHSDIHAKTAVVPFCWHCGADMSGADMREEN